MNPNWFTTAVGVILVALLMFVLWGCSKGE